ncbi:MAG: sugar ABC transporter permease [Desulfobacterales bacterium]|nr:sugar ABC transporter permease [Desulfobacterales bacterium]
MKKATPYLFLFLPFLFFAVFCLYPIIWSFRLSFFKWGVITEEFVGLGNYAVVIKDPYFWKAFGNTLIYVATTVVGQVALGLLVAGLLTKIGKGRSFFSTAIYIPVVTSWAVIAVVWKMMLAPDSYGLFNSVLLQTNMINSPIPWLATPLTARFSIIAFCIWKGVGWAMLIFLAALHTIPKRFYEMAKIDGIGVLGRFRKITFPLISPVIGMVSALLLIGAFNIFPQVYVLTGGGPLGATESLLTLQYKEAFSFLHFGYASAMGYILVPIILFVSILQIKAISKRVEY